MILKGIYATIYIVIGIFALGIWILECLRGKRPAPKETIEGLVAKLATVSLTNNDAEIAALLDDVLYYVRQDEGCLAIETLCDNLIEYDFPLSQELFSEIETLAAWHGADADRVTHLRVLVV